jgi:hypothetical protein
MIFIGFVNDASTSTTLHTTWSSLLFCVQRIVQRRLRNSETKVASDGYVETQLVMVTVLLTVAP